jgi:cobalt-zinc-cadmium efflux system outer membrane protein
MFMTRVHLLSAAVVLFTATAFSPVFAGQQAGSPEGPLLLRDAIAEALAKNPELIALRGEADAMLAVPAQERYLAPPMLETQIWGWPVTTLNPTRTDMYMFMAEQELPGRGKRAARVLVAERDADMSTRQIAVRANEILNEVKQAYVDLAVARESSAIYAREGPLIQDLAEAATLRYAAGQTGQHHTVTALLDLTRLQMERIASDERARLAEARLNAALGRPQGHTIGPLAPVTSTVTVAEIEQLTVDRHPEIAMANASIAREEAELARLRNERRPDFVVGGGYMLMPGDAGAWTARAGVTWTNAPWSRGRLGAAIDAQVKRVAAASARRDALASTIRRTVREAAVRLAAAEQRAQLVESTILPQIEHAFELARAAYASGSGEFTEVLESRRLLLANEIELASARADVQRARADVESAGGVQ